MDQGFDDRISPVGQDPALVAPRPGEFLPLCRLEGSPGSLAAGKKAKQQSALDAFEVKARRDQVILTHCRCQVEVAKLNAGPDWSPAGCDPRAGSRRACSQPPLPDADVRAGSPAIPSNCGRDRQRECLLGDDDVGTVAGLATSSQGEERWSRSFDNLIVGRLHGEQIKDYTALLASDLFHEFSDSMDLRTNTGGLTRCHDDSH
ncbi:hypothetical protein WN48_10714 [Eufriesea mexicana]|uniref:Uncharacterized protein n=1 Tax=Eufriesea mexicana TaxID=516756 RepID=A0A310SSH9_9HYME|nr:hypothetical protein WN48_10714 [Eufriesea mexicana]